MRVCTRMNQRHNKATTTAATTVTVVVIVVVRTGCEVAHDVRSQLTRERSCHAQCAGLLDRQTRDGEGR